MADILRDKINEDFRQGGGDVMIELWSGIAIGISLSFIAYKIRGRSKHSDETLGRFTDQMKDVIYIFDVKPVFRFRYISPSLDDYLGEGTVAQNYEDPYDCFRRIHPDDYELLVNKVTGHVNYDEPILQRWQTNDGRYLWFEEYTTPIYEGAELVAVQGIIRNVEAAVAEREALVYESRHDSLTGVWNRRAFDETIDRWKDKSIAIGVIIVDLNDLKRVNDEHGHSAGDQLLQRTAHVLTSRSLKVYRLGGDEFVVLMSEVAQSLFDQLSLDIRDAFDEAKISAALGSAWHEQVSDFKALYDEADRNMYVHKHRLKQETSLVH